MDAEADAVAAREKEKREKTEEYYHDKVAEAQKEAAHWQEKYEEAEAAKRKLAEDAQKRDREFGSLSTQLQQAEAKAEQKTADHEAANEAVEGHLADIRAMKKQVADTLSDLRDREEEKRKLQGENDDLEAKRVMLNTEIDDLRKAHEDNSAVSQQSFEARDALVALNEQFEEMFKDLGENLSLNDYIDHVRVLQQRTRLRRDDSQASLASDPGEPEAGQSSRRSKRQISTNSMADELKGTEGGSEAGEGEFGEQDDTLTNGGNFGQLQPSHFDEAFTGNNDAALGQPQMPSGGDGWDEWQLQQTQIGGGMLDDPADSAFNTFLDNPLNGMITPWVVTHDDEPQSVRNDAVPGHVEKVGQDPWLDEWQHKRTQTPAAWVAAKAPPPPGQPLPVRPAMQDAGTSPATPPPQSSPVQQTLGFSGVIPGPNTAPIAPQPTPPVPATAAASAAPASSQDEVKQLKIQLGSMKLNLDNKEKARTKAFNISVEKQREITQLQDTIQELQNGAPAPAAQSAGDTDDPAMAKQLKDQLGSVKLDLENKETARARAFIMYVESVKEITKLREDLLKLQNAGDSDEVKALRETVRTLQATPVPPQNAGGNSTDVETVRSENEELRRKNEELQKKVEEFEQETSADLEKERLENEKKIMKIKDDNGKELQGLRNDLEAKMKAQPSDYSAESETLRAEKEELSSEIEELEQTAEKVKDRLKTQGTELKTQGTEIKTLRGEKEELRRKHEELQRTAEKLKDEGKTQGTEIETLRGEKEEQRREHEELQRTAERQAEAQKNAEYEIRGMKTAGARWKTTLENRDRSIEEKDETIRTLKNDDTRTRTRTISELRGQLRAAGPPRKPTRSHSTQTEPRPLTLPELFNALPWWLQILLALLMALLAMAFAHVLRMEYVWRAANDTTHEQVLRTGRYVWLSMIEEWAQVDTTLLG